MVRARLHIICGNCGCNDSFEYHHSEGFIDNEDSIEQQHTAIVCKNCSTIHYLDDNAKNTNKSSKVILE